MGGVNMLVSGKKITDKSTLFRFMKQDAPKHKFHKVSAKPLYVRCFLLSVLYIDHWVKKGTQATSILQMNYINLKANTNW